MDAVTRDIVRKILVPDPNIRLDIKAIMQHKFFADVDWGLVSRGNTEPPYCPPIENLVSPTASNPTGLAAKGKLCSENNKLQMISENQDGITDTNNAPSEPTETSSRKTNFMDMKAFKQKFANSNSNGYKGPADSRKTSNSSPYFKKTAPSTKILGDYHLTKINQVFEDF